MGAPVLIGAGIGAVGSLATGRSPLQGALLGGITGGAFGGAEGFGSGFTQGGLFSSAVPDAVASQGLNAGVAGQSFDDALLTSDQLIGNTANPETMGLIADPSAINPAMQLDSSIGVQIPDQSLLATNDLVPPMIEPQTTGGFGVNVGEFAPQVPTDINQIDTANLINAPKQPSLYESLTSRAYEGLKNMSTMDKVSLGAMTLDAVSPQDAQADAQKMMQGGGQRINPGKPVDVNNTGSGMLNVKVPGIMDEIKKKQVRSLFSK